MLFFYRTAFVLGRKLRSEDEFNHLDNILKGMFTRRPETEADETTETEDIREEWLSCIAEVCKGIFNPLDPRETGLLMHSL